MLIFVIPLAVVTLLFGYVVKSCHDSLELLKLGKLPSHARAFRGRAVMREYPVFITDKEEIDLDLDNFEVITEDLPFDREVLIVGSWDRGGFNPLFVTEGDLEIVIKDRYLPLMEENVEVYFKVFLFLLNLLMISSLMLIAVY